MHLRLIFACSILICSSLMATEDFSGPQPGEKLPEFSANVVFGPNADKTIKLGGEKDKPALILFVHELTRPSIGLIRMVVDYSNGRKSKDIQATIIFLTDDKVDTKNWLNRARRALPQKVDIAISPDGLDGPGALGLNKKMQVTALLVKDNKVSANFAITQPSPQADALKIATSIAKSMGDKTMPTIKELSAGRMMNRTERSPATRPDDGAFRALISPVIQKTATKEEVDAAAKKVESEAAKDPQLKKRIYDVANRIIDAGKLSNYGTEHAQTYLKKWSKSMGSSKKED